MADDNKIKMADLTSMSLAELQSLQKKVAKAITKVERQEKTQALAALEAKAKEMGFSLSELTGGKTAKTAGPKGAPKYANPDNPDQTWTGRGRRPEWIKTALEAGKSIDDLAI